jgi:predicted enzyme related to lactoylglutathione lyase
MAELSLVEFPADDLARARRFWERLLDVPLAEREKGEGRGVQTRSSGVGVGVHERGPGPGDRVSLPYFEVADVAQTLALVEELGGEVIHPGERWAICRDSEGSPFGLARSPEAQPGSTSTSSQAS